MRIKPGGREGVHRPAREVSRWASYVVSVMVIATLVAGLGAQYWAAVWGLQIAALVLPWAALGVGGMGLVWALRRRWGLALGHGGVLAFVLLRGLSGTWGDRAVMTTEPSLTVISFNTRAGSGNVTQERVRAMLHEVSPDVVALQELPLRLFGDSRTAGPPLIVPLIQDGYRVLPPEGGAPGIYLQPVFSRLSEGGASELLAGPDGGSLWRSGSVRRTEVMWGGRAIAIYNVHLHSFGPERPWKTGALLSIAAWREALRVYKEDFDTRAEQARALRRWLNAETLPFVVSGDLNSTPATWVYGHVARGLRDSFAEAGWGWGMTYHARLPLFRIDHVLASPHWAVRRAYVYRGVSSDHFPVVAELALRTPSP